MTLTEAKELIEFCKAQGITRVKLGEFEAEISTAKAPMPLDPVTLSKTFADAMPPDSVMLMASAEDIPVSPEDVEPKAAS